MEKCLAVKQSCLVINPRLDILSDFGESKRDQNVLLLGFSYAVELVSKILKVDQIVTLLIFRLTSLKGLFLGFWTFCNFLKNKCFEKWLFFKILGYSDVSNSKKLCSSLNSTHWGIFRQRTIIEEFHNDCPLNISNTLLFLNIERGRLGPFTACFNLNKIPNQEPKNVFFKIFGYPLYVFVV